MTLKQEAFKTISFLWESQIMNVGIHLWESTCGNPPGRWTTLTPRVKLAIIYLCLVELSPLLQMRFIMYSIEE